jgi:hypothetical protein
MKFLAAALILFIGVTGDLAIESAASSASAAAPSAHVVAVGGLHHAHPSKQVHSDPFVWSH